jgi:uncharacterized paraquat-inducible protein A
LRSTRYSNKKHEINRNTRRVSIMRDEECRECAHMPDNAESSVKCKQCGNMVSVGDMSSEGMVSCPVCGATVSSWDTMKSEVSNEDY